MMPGFDYHAHQSPENRTAMRTIIEIWRTAAVLRCFARTELASGGTAPFSRPHKLRGIGS
jgi:hypothetical protein